MKNFFANKKIGYYVVIADILLAIFLGIYFFATYKEYPAGYGGIGMAQNAYANIPEVIGLFILLGAVIDIALLVLPEFLWIHLLAIVSYCVSFMKQVYCIPNLIADEINQVHYQGGSLPLNITWLVIQVVIIASAIAVLFIGVIKEDEEETLKKEKLQGAKLIKVASSGVAVVAAFVIVMVNYGNIYNSVKKGSSGSTVKTFAERVQARIKDFEDKVVDYDFNPAEFKLSKEDNPYSDPAVKSTISSTVGAYDIDQERVDEDGNVIHKVYTFEGATAEGWQGDYSLKIVRITLWEDGLYNGKNTNGGSTVDDLRGYWYNVDEYGSDCLIMISGTNNYDYDLVCDSIAGEQSFYEWRVDVHANYNTQQGGRYIKGNGVKYYPVIGMFVDTGSENVPQYKVGSQFDRSSWTCIQVRNDLRAGSVFDAEHEVTWSKPDMNEIGTQTVTATWKKEGQEFTSEVQIEIVE